MSESIGRLLRSVLRSISRSTITSGAEIIRLGEHMPRIHLPGIMNVLHQLELLSRMPLIGTQRIVPENDMIVRSATLRTILTCHKIANIMTDTSTVPDTTETLEPQLNITIDNTTDRHRNRILALAGQMGIIISEAKTIGRRIIELRLHPTPVDNVKLSLMQTQRAMATLYDSEKIFKLAVSVLDIPVIKLLVISRTSKPGVGKLIVITYSTRIRICTRMPENRV